MDEEKLYADLNSMWQEHDPVPAGLADRMVAAVAIDDLDMEYELLSLITRDTTMAGARSTQALETATVSKLEFGNGNVSVLVRIVADQVGTSRIDGWVTPAGDITVRIGVQTWVGDSFETQEQAVSGRFSFVGVPHGLGRLWLDSLQTGVPAKTLATPLMEI